MAVCRAESQAQIAAARILFLEYAASLGFDLDFQDFEEEMASFPREYSPPLGALLLDQADGVAVGCVGVRRFADGVCEMKRLYVRPQFRRRGIGRELAAAAIAAARELGYHSLRLDTIPSMVAAVRLYENLGFRSIAPYRRNPIAGAAFMELELDSMT